jgi:phage recombination protein Bet
MTKALMSHDDINTLSQAGIIPAGTPPAQVAVFAEACRQHGLSPFKKEIYLTAYNTRKGTIYSTIVGIDGIQAIAARTGRFAGVDDAKFDLQPDGTYATAGQLKAANRLPNTCTVTVYAVVGGIRCPFTATVVFSEYYPGVVSGSDTYSKAATMPFNMIAKCARAKAIKMAFSDATAGLHIEEEAAAFEDKTIDAIAAMPELGIDEAALEAKVAACRSREELAALYKSSPVMKQYAHLFTDKAEALAELNAQ